MFPSSLHNLTCDHSKRFMKQATICELEGAIELFCAALELCTPGHQHWPSLLCELVLCLSNRYENQGLGVVNGLEEEAILLGHTVLELCPTGHPNHGISLHLAHDLWMKFQ
ncbi:hypothetical protein F5J12DRAFT_724224 [Pisolithus orientalis]|uniref:uncharacterized protein n=1 Tax=Pisolithus orientalis TaxID=936130 RepID=UPI00222581F1|nr:uncharacterized protein F5J12DRAFT_724224 [Pisolithus orientalis]KAI6000206.1 hypothetical protein F5J12DRAFT_724224 [Pisolithus orientalis]